MAAVVAAVIGVPPGQLGGAAGLTDGSWSSMQHITILLDLAGAFGFELTPRLVQELTTVAAMQAFVSDRRDRAPLPTSSEAAMTLVLQQLREILAGPNTAVLATVRPDGKPQQFVVWAVADGDDILMSTTQGRPKHRNLAAFPHASLTVYPAGDMYRSVEVRGTSSFVEAGADEVIERLSRHYKGTSWQEPAGLGTRVTVRLSGLVPGKD
ncbi:PPOX class F420-dependent oxidoreductase [Kitasatospora viridis]|uniref:PPOX class F420-dependent oxidoreductase n=1 Tax=Kitasatospora viridis TaxID=281105 RepID=UPI0011A408CC|nr:PPOX class F420-dependent oxidoreductase [Kitasatospora viridis]